MGKYKVFYKRILITVICILTIISVINIVIDPYVVFHTPATKISNLKPEAKRQERITKIIEFKLDRRKIDTVFIGTSRIDWIIDKDYFHKVTGKNATNLGIVGMNFEEYVSFPKTVLEIHPEIKNIYLGLDFYIFNKNVIDNQKHEGFNKNPRLTTSELATVLFASDTTVSSFITISKNLHCKDFVKMYRHDGLIYIFDNPVTRFVFEHVISNYIDRFKNYEIDASTYDKLKELDLYCKKKGVKLHIFHTEGHTIDLATIYIGGYWDIYTQWKKDLTKVSDIYDFHYINKYSTEKLKPRMEYFYDIAHGTPKTGNLMIDKLVLNNGDYGRLNTKDNIEALTIQDTIDLKKWLKANPEWVKTINKIKKREEAKQDAI